MSSSDIDYVEEEEVYDKFNELTFDVRNDINIDKFNFVVDDVKNERSKEKSIDDNNKLISPEKSISTLGQIDRVFKIGIHPLLMLSDLHRHRYPIKHNRSMTCGRYDYDTQVITYLLFNSEIMTGDDKFNMLLEVTKPIMFTDNALTAPSRDYYYWMKEYKHSKNIVSRIVDLYSVVDSGYAPKEFRVPVIKFEGNLGCIAISGVKYPRLSINLNEYCCSKESHSSNFSKYTTLATLENLYMHLIEFETINIMSKRYDPELYDARYRYASSEIAKVLFKNDSLNFVHDILLIEKGRIFLARLLSASMIPFKFDLTRIIILSMSKFKYDENQSSQIFYHLSLCEELYLVMTFMELSFLCILFNMVLSSETQLIHTYVGLNIIIQLFVHISAKPRKIITDSDAAIINECTKHLIQALSVNIIPKQYFSRYKSLMKMLYSFANKIYRHPLFDSNLVEMKKIISNLIATV